MKTEIEKTEEPQWQSAAGNVKGLNMPSARVFDKRPLAAVQRRLQTQTEEGRLRRESEWVTNTTYRPVVQRVGQGEVQDYLESIAPEEGPIRDYIDEHAGDNGGLCAGWVVLHRKNPGALIRMWEQVSDEITGKQKMGIRQKDEAVKMYIEAQFHFANDPDNAEFVAPDQTTLNEVGLSGETDDTTVRVAGKKNVDVKYGEIFTTATSILEKYKGSKKHVFIEIYDTGHTTQIEFRLGKPVSVCESEAAGVVTVSSGGVVDKILSSYFFDNLDTPDEYARTKLSFDLYAAK